MATKHRWFVILVNCQHAGGALCLSGNSFPFAIHVQTFDPGNGHEMSASGLASADKSGVSRNPLTIEQAGTQQKRDFLYQLESGKALLEQGRVSEAKSAFERSLSLEPRDVEAQSLLGLVYFRLGHFERAAAVYEHLEQVCPEEVAPKFNLALSYLKTGALDAARTRLEEVVAQVPDHTRAWAYLGVARQRLGDTEAAAVAFERSGRSRLANRARQQATTERNETTAPTRPGPGAAPTRAPSIAQHEIDELALPPSSQVSLSTDLPFDVEEGTLPYYQLGHTPEDLGQIPESEVAAAVSRNTSLLSAFDWFNSHQLTLSSGRFIRRLAKGRLSCSYAGVLYVRQHLVRAVFPDASTDCDAANTVRLDWTGEGVRRLLGSGLAVLEVARQHLHFVELRDEALYFRANALAGYSGSPTVTLHSVQPDWVSFDAVRLDPGEHPSTVLFSTWDEPLTMPLNGQTKAVVSADWLLGWYGQLFITPCPQNPDQLALHGTGGVFLDPGRAL